RARARGALPRLGRGHRAADHGLQQPRGQRRDRHGAGDDRAPRARSGCRGRDQGVLGRRAPPRRAARARRRARGAGRWRRLGAGGLLRRRHGVDRRRGRGCAARVRGAVRGLPRGRARARPRDLPAPAAARAPGHDAQARPVLQGRDRRRGPLRRAVPRAAPAAGRRRAGDARRRRARPARAATGMRAARVLHAVDSHTEGMPTRVVTGGVGVIPGATMLERKLHFEAEMDELRLLLMREPRGHSAMSGAILQPPTRDDADVGVLFIEVSGYLPMCGHGTIGVATVLVETGMVEVTEPETEIALDTPAGLVRVRVAVENGRATSVTLRNVPSFLLARDREVGGVPYDMAYGGNFYALIEAAAAGV